MERLSACVPDQEAPRTECYQVLRTEEEGGHRVRLQNRSELRYNLDPPSCLLDENRDP